MMPTSRIALVYMCTSRYINIFEMCNIYEYSYAEIYIYIDMCVHADMCVRADDVRYAYM